MHMNLKKMLIATAFALGATIANARSWQSGPVTVEVVDGRSRAFEQFPASGSGGDVFRAYLQAERGSAYRIRVRNRSNQRVGLVIAVDGRNIVSGERSELDRREAMYVLEPWAEGEYAGWRKSLSSINEFYFTDWRDSYAEAFGDRSARGVIAVAAFPEQQRVWREPAYEDQLDQDGDGGARGYRRKAEAAGSMAPSAAASADAAAAPQRSKSRAAEPGTGYGDRRDDPARRVEFEAQSRAFARVFLKYEWPETLCERRISCPDNARRGRDRNRFWREDTYGFAPPPPRR